MERYKEEGNLLIAWLIPAITSTIRHTYSRGTSIKRIGATRSKKNGIHTQSCRRTNYSTNVCRIHNLIEYNYPTLISTKSPNVR